MYKKGAVSLSMTFLIFIIIALIVLVVLSSAVRSYIVGGLDYFSSLLGRVGGQTSPVSTSETSFVAYLCSTQSNCGQFQNITPYNTTFWYVYYNGNNLSSILPSAIYFSAAIGNYSFTVYNISVGSSTLCSNLSGNAHHDSGYSETGIANIIYYSQTSCP